MAGCCWGPHPGTAERFRLPATAQIVPGPSDSCWTVGISIQIWRRKVCPYLPTVRGRDETTVDREETAAHENLQDTTDWFYWDWCFHFTSALSETTWMSSSLLSNCDTSTFFPSASLVRDTQSRPDARRWASAGSFSRRESWTTCSKLNPGWKTPKDCFLTFLARFNTSAQKWSERHHSKGHQLTWDLQSFSCWTEPGHVSFYFLLLIAVVFLLSCCIMINTLLFLLFRPWHQPLTHLTTWK